jgi:hypothetical protein
VPTIAAKRVGPCTACGFGILVGEQIDFTRETGARHLACAESAPQRRRNLYRARCHLCATWVKPSEGDLKVIEVDGGRRNVVSCIDAAACSARIPGQGEVRASGMTSAYRAARRRW